MAARGTTAQGTAARGTTAQGTAARGAAAQGTAARGTTARGAGGRSSSTAGVAQVADALAGCRAATARATGAPLDLPVGLEGGHAGGKVRVAIADRPGALASVVAAVEAACAGARVVAELQEVDRTELVVQLDVAVPRGGGVFGSAGPASLLGWLAGRTDLEVLSSWAAQRRGPGASRKWPVRFARDGEPGLPPVALRALGDGVPTAWWGDLVRWPPDGAPDRVRGPRSGWVLAVPLPAVGRSGAVGRTLAMVARAGRLRFDAADAEHLALRCGAHPSLGPVPSP